MCAESPSKNDLGGNVTDTARFEWGSDSAGVLRRYSSLRWNNHVALLVPCTPSRRVRFAAMQIYEMGSGNGYAAAERQPQVPFLIGNRVFLNS